MLEKRSEQKEDLRIRRTYKLLLDSLISLLEEKSFEEISVIDICDQAMVHRSTFYKHFNDKYHLLEFGMTELIKNFNRVSALDQNFDTSKQYYMNIIRYALYHLSANKKRALFVMVKSTSSSLMAILHRLLVEEIKLKLEYNEKNGYVHHIPIPIIAEFHAGALLALAKWWLENKMPVSEEEIVKYIDLMINNDKYLSVPKHLALPSK